MCGIVGIFQQDCKTQIEERKISEMMNRIIHRGPDEEGVYTNKEIGLGFRRLSIIDLVNGSQPMKDTQVDNYIIFNGEIYNYLELRNELIQLGYNFKTKSDTEVLLKMYLHYKEDCVKKLNGMFSFAIWNQNKKELFIARDRIGKKPLYYYHGNGIFYFASELKCFSEIKEIPKKICHTALDQYFSHDGIPSPLTIFKDIYELPAATYMIVTKDNLFKRKYWEIDGKNKKKESEKNIKMELRDLVFDATKKRMISDVPIGAFLSGGIDSSIITGAMSNISENNIKTFSISGGDGPFNELAFAKKVAEFNKTDHYEYTLNNLDLRNLVPKLIDSFDQPFTDSSMIPTYYVSKFAKQQVTVALSGEGGDELFGGYERYKKLLMVQRWRMVPSKIRTLISRIIKSNSINQKINKNFIFSLIKKFFVMNNSSLGTSDSEVYRTFMTLMSSNEKKLIFSKELQKKIIDNYSINYSDILDEVFTTNPQKSILENAQLTDLRKYLHDDILVKVDRMSMANSLEVRSPLLDYRIIEFAFSLPDNLKIKNDCTKYILRESMKDLMPSDIYMRKDKRGFSVPISKWIREDLAVNLKEVIFEGKILDSGLFNRVQIEKMISLHNKKIIDYGPQIWSLFIMSLWMQNNNISL